MAEPEGAKPGIHDGTEMTVLQGAVPGGKCVGTIAICTRDSLSAQTAISWRMDKGTYLGPGEYALTYIVQGNVLVFQRNQCVRDMDGDWLLFIDSDMVFQPGTIADIIQTREKYDFDILGGLCHQRMPPYQPTVYRRVAEEHHGYTFLETWPEGAAIEVDATGMAFCLIHKRVFDRILEANTGSPMPPREQRLLMPPPPFFRWEGEYGEDFDFCQQAKASGSRIYVDTTIEIGHVGPKTFTRDDFLREVAFRPPESQAFREKQLADVGERALTQGEALEEVLGPDWTLTRRNPTDD